MINYTVDENAVIRDIDGDWDKFAADNQAGDLNIKCVIGTLLWPYFTEETRMIYHQLLSKVHVTGKKLEFNIRCDCLHKKRQLLITLTKHGKNTKFQSDLINEEDRSLDYADGLMVNQASFGRALFMCSFCNRAHVKGGDFAELEDLAAQGLLDNDRLRLIRYSTICDTCNAGIALLKR